MSIWLVRAGAHGEYEKKFLEENRVYLTWEGLSTDLGKLSQKLDLKSVLQQTYPDATVGRIRNNTGQVWAFAKDIQPGDWVVLPSKHKPAIHIAEIKGGYAFDQKAQDPFYHYREVKWIAHDVPRSNFDQDLLYSFGAFMTVCQISRNDAENRIRAMGEKGWKVSGVTPYPSKNIDETVEAESAPTDISLAARDRAIQGSWTRPLGRRSSSGTGVCDLPKP